jgi:hypothetical protein
MKQRISFEKIWFDDDIVELKIKADNGNSSFSNTVYVGHQQLIDLVKSLSNFKDHVYGGLFDIELGEFGPEYGNGAFSARLHFQEKGKLYLSIRMQSDFFNFGKKNVASEAYLYLISEPALLDKFIIELQSLDGEIGSTARLECIGD